MLKNSLFQPFSVSALPPCFFFFLPFFSFQFTCALFSSPKTFFSAQNNSLFSPKTFFFSPNVFASAQNLFQFSPHHCFSLFLFCFSLFSFCLAPPFLLSFSASHSLFLANFQGQKYSL